MILSTVLGIALAVTLLMLWRTWRAYRRTLRIVQNWRERYRECDADRIAILTGAPDPHPWTRFLPPSAN